MARSDAGVGSAQAALSDPSAREVTDANIAYHTELADEYDERMELYHPRVQNVYRELFERHVFSRFPAGASLSALDVGCGTGLLETFLVPRVSDVVAFDICPAMLEVARRKHPQIAYGLGDAYAMPAEADRSFDIVCGNALLHHIKDYETVLQEMTSRVRPGGVLFLGYEPNALAFSLFAPLRVPYRKLMPEQRVSGVAEKLGSEHEGLAEYHQFYAHGLSPRRIARRLRREGFDDVRTFYRAEHFLALLKDRVSLDWIEWFPTVLLRLVGPLSVSFHIIAGKSANVG
jgi:ubiquinone/menaquinone biosynthesis C-methylase UbiE